MKSIYCKYFMWLLVLMYWQPPQIRADEPVIWNKEKAGLYLDDRAEAWFAFNTADRGEGSTKTSCICCHTIVPYAVARPALRRLLESQVRSEYEDQLVKQTRLRVERWADLDSDKFGLLYDFNDEKKKESWGTEAVLNAVVLACEDRNRGRSEPDDSTKKAMSQLWNTQIKDGNHKGSWDWLNFNFEPWESEKARYYGAALAAVAVGTAPGYYKTGTDATVDANVELLKGYLKSTFSEQSLYNRVWALWASVWIEGIVDADEKQQVIAELFEKQHTDGGWALSSFGTFSRRDGSPQATMSDGYATGLILHVLQEAGIKKDEPRVAKGIAWLCANQSQTGQWNAYSLNKNRNLETHVGRFMSDAATAFSVLALSH